MRDSDKRCCITRELQMIGLEGFSSRDSTCMRRSEREREREREGKRERASKRERGTKSQRELDQKRLKCAYVKP